MPDPNSPRVLVIDDEVTQRMLVKEYLEAAGFQVRLSEDGRHGLKMATTVNLDLVIVDAVLPSLDGYSIVSQLRQQEKTADIPIILITASKEPDAIAKGLAAGATDFITKPVEWQFFSDRVTHVIDKSRERRELEAQRDLIVKELKETQGQDERRTKLVQFELQKVTQAFEQERAALLADTAERIKSAETEAAQQIEEIQREHARQAVTDRAKSAAELQDVRDGLEQKIRAIRTEADERVRKAHASTALLVESGRRSAEQQIKALKTANEAQILEAKADFQAQLEQAQRAAADRIRQAEAKAEEAGKAQALMAAKSAAASETTDASARSIWAFTAAAARQQSKLTQLIYAACAEAEGQVAAGASADDLRGSMTRVQRAAAGLAAFMKSYGLVTELMTAQDPAADEEIALEGVLMPITERVRSLCADRALALATRVDTDITSIGVDAIKLRYALLGLVLNAIRFSVAGSKIVLFTTRLPDGGLAIGVSDDGVGMAPNLINRIRRCLDEPSALVDPKGETIGLGLAVASAVARSHGGHLMIDGNIGQGTTAAIILPAARVHGTADTERAAISG